MRPQSYEVAMPKRPKRSHTVHISPLPQPSRGQVLAGVRQQHSIVYCRGVLGLAQLTREGFTYLQSMDFQREPQSKHHLYCVCVFSSHSFWTSMDVPAGVTQEEGNTGFSIHLLSAVRALIFLARRIQPFLSLVDREVEFCVLTI